MAHDRVRAVARGRIDIVEASLSARGKATAPWRALAHDIVRTCVPSCTSPLSTSWRSSAMQSLRRPYQICVQAQYAHSGCAPSGSGLRHCKRETVNTPRGDRGHDVYLFWTIRHRGGELSHIWPRGGGSHNAVARLDAVEPLLSPVALSRSACSRPWHCSFCSSRLWKHSHSPTAAGRGLRIVRAHEGRAPSQHRRSLSFPDAPCCTHRVGCGCSLACRP